MSAGTAASASLSLAYVVDSELYMLESDTLDLCLSGNKKRLDILSTRVSAALRRRIATQNGFLVAAYLLSLPAISLVRSYFICILTKIVSSVSYSYQSAF